MTDSLTPEDVVDVRRVLREMANDGVDLNIAIVSAVYDWQARRIAKMEDALRKLSDERIACGSCVHIARAALLPINEEDEALIDAAVNQVLGKSKSIPLLPPNNRRAQSFDEWWLEEGKAESKCLSTKELARLAFERATYEPATPPNASRLSIHSLERWNHLSAKIDKAYGLAHGGTERELAELKSLIASISLCVADMRVQDRLASPEPRAHKSLIDLFKAVDTKYAHAWHGLSQHEREALDRGILRAWGNAVAAGVSDETKESRTIRGTNADGSEQEVEVCNLCDHIKEPDCACVAPETGEPKSKPCPLPQIVGYDVDGREISPGIFGIGKVYWHEGGHWRCLANVNGTLCVIEVSVTMKGASETGGSQS